MYQYSCSNFWVTTSAVSDAANWITVGDNYTVNSIQWQQSDRHEMRLATEKEWLRRRVEEMCWRA